MTFRIGIATGALAAAVAFGAAPGMAEDPPPFPVFEAKRVGVPSTAPSRRITVQIDPTAVEAALAVPPEPQPEADPAPTELAFDWFWTQVSPALGDADAGRLKDALGVLTTGGDAQPRPGLDDMRVITDKFGKDILLATLDTRVSPALVAAVILVESSGRPDAVSGAGASGLMQLMPATAERFGVEDPLDAVGNIRGGVAYLDWLLEEFGHDPLLSLAGYNAGENAVKKHGGIPPYDETRGYVPKVLAAWSVAAALCKSPPLFFSDGCVFVEPEG
jgi:hypothetical protein